MKSLTRYFSKANEFKYIAVTTSKKIGHAPNDEAYPKRLKFDPKRLKRTFQEKSLDEAKANK